MTRNGDPKTLYITEETEQHIAILMERWGLTKRSAVIAKALEQAAARKR